MNSLSSPISLEDIYKAIYQFFLAIRLLYYQHEYQKDQPKKVEK